MTTNTSKKAYKAIRPFLNGKRKAVYDMFLNHENGATRQEIAKWYHQKECSVCGRVNELLANGYLRVVGVRKDTDTNKDCQVLKAIKVAV